MIIFIANGDWKSFDCKMRQLALDYAYNINPHLSIQQLNQIADALNGGPLADNCNVSPSNITKYPSSSQHNKLQNLHSKLQHTPTIYVDAINGNDNYKNNDPSNIQTPLKTIQSAIQYARIKYGQNTLKQIVIRKGKYYLLNTIQLTPVDSNTIFTNYNNEMVNISGAVPIVKNNNNICNWNLYQQKPNNLGIYTCLVNILA